jgi:hypothetical protein
MIMRFVDDLQRLGVKHFSQDFLYFLFYGHDDLYGQMGGQKQPFFPCKYRKRC